MARTGTACVLAGRRPAVYTETTKDEREVSMEGRAGNREVNWANRVGRVFRPAMAVSIATISPAGAAGFDGAHLGVAWAIPFAGILLSIALFPLLAPTFWHHHFGKVAAAWGVAFLVPFALAFGPGVAASETLHVLFLEYLPFVIVLAALFTISGGILVRGNLHGSPALNTGLLTLGTVLASLIGTTGASMVLIRPLLRANDGRRHSVHVVVFFIFLVSNIGGALTPLGDPPLFLGYLQGVSFFWTTRNIFDEMLIVSAILLCLFWLLDGWLYRRDSDFRPLPDPTPDTSGISISGKVNFALLGVVVAAVLMSGSWDPQVTFDVGGIHLELQNVLRDAILIATGIASLVLTPKGLRPENGFSWDPILEVAKLFAGIFLTMVPVIAMLKAAGDGAFAPLVALVEHADGSADVRMYFWLTGLLSSFLDNAPTYLVFFNLAGGDPIDLMGKSAAVLAAISCGAVFMGANTYIGNAPNFMVKAIAEKSGVAMPSFFGYMAWSGGILVPIFIGLSLLF
jgi:Na+/H+ antiporter NhaD/arsenite permease-like protein